jgi:hypothetical protein
MQSGWKRSVQALQTQFGPVECSPKETARAIQPSQRAPDNDVALWPDALARRAMEVATEVGCDVTVPLIAGLAAVSAAADKRTTLRLTNTWKVPPTIWLMTIGEPADKKTPGSKPMFKPLQQLEIDDKPRHSAAILQWQGQEARYASQMKAYREWSASPESGFPGAVPPEMGGCPPEPKPLRLLIQDATTQKIVSMSEGRPRGFLLYLDEMNRWLMRLSDLRNTDDRGCWIQGYETGRYTMDRQAAGTIQAENMALSIYGNCQPRVFRENVVGASSDGLIQRFMPVTLDASKNAMWQHSVPDFASHASDYDALIRRINTIEEQSYDLSPGALEAFQDFSKWALYIRENERLLRNSEAYQTALGKMEGNCARLILLFHLIDNPYVPFVSPETATRAIRLMREFFIPSLRHAFLEIGHQRDQLAQTVTDFILQGAGVMETVTLGDLRRVCKKQLQQEGRKPEQSDGALRVIMDELTLAGYVAMLTDHPRYPKWTINPHIATQFAAEREKIIRAKQTVLREMEKAFYARGRKEPMGNTLGWDSIAH